MNFLNNLANAIRKRSSGVELSEVEKSVYEQAYCDYFGKNSSVINRDSEVFDYYCSLFTNMIRNENMLRFKVFNGLLHYNKSSVSLIDFCRFCGIDGVSIDEKNIIISNINSWFDREEDKINLDDEKFNSSLLIIKSLDNINIDNSTTRNLRFAIITGLNIGGKCIDENGQIDEVKLYDSLSSYISFRDRFISDMKENDVLLDGIVFMGDLFDIFSGVGAIANTNVRVINSLVKKLMAFSKNNKDIVNIDDCGFIGVVSGHNDIWFGNGLNDAIKIFGEKAMYLGKFGPCTIEKNNYEHFSKYLYDVYNDYMNGERSKEGMLCYFISPDTASDLRIKDKCYDVTLCDLVVDGIRIVDYGSHTITYDSKYGDYGIGSNDVLKVKLK